MRQAEADIELMLSALTATAVSQILLTMAKFCKNTVPYTLILMSYLYIDLFKAVILRCTWGHFITADIRWHFNYISLSRQIVKIEP